MTSASLNREDGQTPVGKMPGKPEPPISLPPTLLTIPHLRIDDPHIREKPRESGVAADAVAASEPLTYTPPALAGWSNAIRAAAVAVLAVLLILVIRGRMGKDKPSGETGGPAAWSAAEDAAGDTSGDPAIAQQPAVNGAADLAGGDVPDPSTVVERAAPSSPPGDGQDNNIQNNRILPPSLAGPQSASTGTGTADLAQGPNPSLHGSPAAEQPVADVQVDSPGAANMDSIPSASPNGTTYGAASPDRAGSFEGSFGGPAHPSGNVTGDPATVDSPSGSRDSNSEQMNTTEPTNKESVDGFSYPVTNPANYIWPPGEPQLLPVQQASGASAAVGQRTTAESDLRSAQLNGTIQRNLSPNTGAIR